MEKQALPASRMSRGETLVSLLWLPVHSLGLPLLLLRLFPGMSAARLNFWVYALGAGLLALLCLRFLRRDFDRLWEAPLRVLGQAALGFALILAANAAMSLALQAFFPQENPNNQALLSLARSERRAIIAVTALLAPVLEELIFRGGVFGLVRRKSRAAAYVLCVLLFAVYHTWQYALADPRNWLYLIQYLPAGFFLCRAYDKTECIWTGIFLHMLNNGVSLLALMLLEG